VAGALAIIAALPAKASDRLGRGPAQPAQWVAFIAEANDSERRGRHGIGNWAIGIMSDKARPRNGIRHLTQTMTTEANTDTYSARAATHRQSRSLIVVVFPQSTTNVQAVQYRSRSARCWLNHRVPSWRQFES